MAFFCLGSLLFSRPPRSPQAGTPHQVPAPAIIAALAWLLLGTASQLSPGEPSIPNSSSPDVAAAQAASPLKLLTAMAIEGLISTAILAFTYLSDRLLPPVAIESCPPAPVPLDDTPDESPSPVVEAVKQNRNPPPDFATAIGSGFRVGLAALIPVNVIAILLSLMQVKHETHLLLEMATSMDGTMFRIVIAFIAVVLAPVKEELLFRVILQGWLVDRIGKAGIVGASLIFAMIHGAENGVMLIPLALMLGVLYERTRSYPAVVAAHATFNGANLLMQFYLL
jgi:hypothetical protein